MTTNVLDSYKHCRGLLCGPMTGLPDFNHPAFYAAASVLRDEGYDIGSPAGIFGGDRTLGQQTYTRETLRLVMQAHFLVVLPGWRDSLGAMTEVAVAKALGIPVFDYVTRREVAQQKQEAVGGALFVADMDEEPLSYSPEADITFLDDVEGDDEDEVDLDSEEYGGEVDEDDACCGCCGGYLPDEPAPQRNGDRFDQVLDEIRAMRAAKRADYADSEDQFSNMRMCEKFGVSAFLGCLVRISDKFSRVTQLANHPPMVKSESVRDTLLDLACYAIIASIVREEEVATQLAAEIEQFSAMDQDHVPF